MISLYSIELMARSLISNLCVSASVNNRVRVDLFCLINQTIALRPVSSSSACRREAIYEELQSLIVFIPKLQYLNLNL
jgi:hypothetical protein